MEITTPLGLSESEQAAVHVQWDTFNGALAQLQAEGFQLLANPPYSCPQYLDIETLTSHDSKTLTTEFAKYKAWRDYATNRLSLTKMILVQTKNEMANIEAQTKKALRKKVTAAAVQEEARTNPRYEQLKLQEQKLVQFRDYYDPEVERFDTAMKLISRVITLRGQDIEQNGRGGTIGANGSGRHSGFG